MKQYRVLIGVLLVFVLMGVSYSATNFPTNLDTYTDKTSTDVITSAGWNNIQDAIEAVEEKVGADSSAETSSLDYRMISLETTMGTVTGKTDEVVTADMTKLADITASAAEINTTCDGATAKNSHTHTLAGGATDVTATYAEINTACDGSTARNEHVHSNITITAGTGLSGGGALSASRTVSHAAHTGEVTGTTALTIAADAVDMSNMQHGSVMLPVFLPEDLTLGTTSYTQRGRTYRVYVPADATTLQMAVQMTIGLSDAGWARFKIGSLTSDACGVSGGTGSPAWYTVSLAVGSISGWQDLTIETYWVHANGTLHDAVFAWM